ncbi:F-box/kelch-repeat protein At4g19930-like [Momordica charantia]|uniref:F-box/kelch-repeat protein At4g19930-like n=1 Tax=Momordica charantia TaxID=3673 RepID=A0A6J1CZ64_MOMCH|nr:F-box/kelch-repeat protein At4g19930-like [Momordica charantia]
MELRHLPSSLPLSPPLRRLRPRFLSHILISASQPNSSCHHLLSAALGPLPPLTHLLSLPLRHSLVVKPANGLLLLHFPNDLYSDRPDLPAYIFNRRARDIIPLPPNAPTNQKVKILYHLGYDALGDEYKVLQIWRFIDTNLEMSESGMVFKVLSLGSGKWRRIRPRRIPFFCSSYSALFSPCCASNGGIHWVVHPKKFVLVFNLHDEEFASIPFPQPFIQQQSPIEMWVLKDYQNHIWVQLKEATFQYDMSSEDDDHCSSRLPLPLGSGPRLLYYDIKRRRFRGVEIRGLSEWLSANDVAVTDCSFDAYEENIVTLSSLIA